MLTAAPANWTSSAQQLAISALVRIQEVRRLSPSVAPSPILTPGPARLRGAPCLLRQVFPTVMKDEGKPHIQPRRLTDIRRNLHARCRIAAFGDRHREALEYAYADCWLLTASPFRTIPSLRMAPMTKSTRVLLTISSVASLTAIFAPAPALADGGCIGLQGHCKTIWFDVCANGVCTPTPIDLAGDLTDE